MSYSSRFPVAPVLGGPGERVVWVHLSADCLGRWATEGRVGGCGWPVGQLTGGERAWRKGR